MSRFKWFWNGFVILALIIASCAPVPSLSLSDTLKREDLLSETLLDPAYVPPEPVHNTYFTPKAGVEPAQHTFHGVLRVDEFIMQDSIAPGTARTESGRYFPGFAVEFFTDGEYLVPVEREILFSTGLNSHWGLIFSPGRVWSEAADGGWSRASFPFTMVGRTSNEAHNGLATFLFDDDSVSQFYFQITQETSAWNQSDYWGQPPLTYLPGEIADEAALRAAFTAELAAQMPIGDWDALSGLVEAEALGGFNDDLRLEDISAAGVIIDGMIYLQPVATRSGEYPYPEAMRHGVFSVTKSMGAAVALLRLAQKYGDQVFDLKIVDYVEVTADHDGWEDVTFANALSMATGTGDVEPDRESPNVTADEDQAKFMNWMGMDSAAEKLDGAFRYGKHEWGAGEVVRYNSTITFILGAAMDAFLKEQEGADADIWQMVVEEVYKPIGIQHAPIMRTYEPDGSLGLPIFGYGLFPTIDDAAKVAMLYHQGGSHDGEQLLSPAKLAEALYQTGEQGLPVYQYNQYGMSRYLLSFWSAAYCRTEDDCFQVPYMMGFGGNLVALLPNGVTVFRFADAHEYDPLPMIELGMAVDAEE